jgi:Leucine-rich repeat (LRR) protein
MVSNVEDLMEASFANCTNLEILYLHNNRINGIPDFTFRNNANLRQLDIGMNWIETLGVDAFTGSGIVNLDVDSNRLAAFDQAWFTSIGSTLETLDIVSNGIRSLDEDAFS